MPPIKERIPATATSGLSQHLLQLLRGLVTKLVLEESAAVISVEFLKKSNNFNSPRRQFTYKKIENHKKIKT
jgi:hypothetical protein